MRIRILHVVEALGVGGGVENGIANLLRMMDPNQFEHILCAVFETGARLERYPLDRIRLLDLGQKHGRLKTQVGALAKTIRSVRPDIVHSRNWGAMEAVPAARWAGRCAVVHSEHGVEMDPEKEPGRRRWMRRLLYPMANRIFSVSEELRQILVRRTGISGHEIGVIHNGVDRSRFYPDAARRQRCRQDLNAGDAFLIGAVGRLNRIKDYPTLLRAAERCSRQGRDWRLFIAGSGAERSALEGMAAASPALNGRVVFLGDTANVAEFLNGLDVYVLPSLCEGISNSLLEAMATRLPVIVSDAGGNKEVVEHGVSGLRFPVGNVACLAECLECVWREDLRAELGREAERRIAAEFSLESMIRQYEEMYQTLAGAAAKSQPVYKALCRSGS